MQKYIFAKHQMHFGIKCIFAPTKCDAKIYFGKASNAFVTFCFAKMHLMQKCIFATHQQNVMQKYIFAKRTFSKGKCTQKCI